MTYHILIIDNKYGQIITLHRTKDDAFIALYDYVEDEWNEDLIKEYGDLHSLKHDQAIEQYFKWMDQARSPEYYTLEEVVVS
ncbi:MAG: hypothetical protein RLP14_01970 [Owenweeksia sp.]